jgi:uncharacterized membrane protein
VAAKPAANAPYASNIPRFVRCWWTALGVPALLCFLAVFYLMVARPM